VLEQLRDYFVEADLLGVYVAPDPQQISEIGEDLRGRDQSELTLVVATGVITEMRTIASGDRAKKGGDIDPEQRIDHPLHARILTRSPVRPYDPESDEERDDLLRKDVLDRYLFFLGRHPGRRVDASVAAAEEVGAAALDYIVTENRPLTLYAQVGNTGTSETDYWRERFGLLHTQLTNNDDILSFEYTTANFSDVHALYGSYEAPFPNNDRIRWQVYGSWADLDASDLGVTADDYTSETWLIGGELIANVYQHRELFIDAVAGVRYQDIDVDRRIFGILPISDEEQFLIPYIGARLDRTTEWFSTQGMARLEWQSDATDVDEQAINRLGRTAPDKQWWVLRWNISHSMYLEPLLNPKAWRDPSTPESSTLAHELLLRFHGQYAFDYRLIPQEQRTVGGLYTVRGYPQSAIAADSAYIGTIEYRFHLPRSFTIEPSPREMFGEPFRAAPQYVYGVPDWDLVLKGFFDIGEAQISDRFPFESNETLIGAGIGVDFLYKRNLNVRVDWGFALDELESAGVSDGANRLYVVATILF
jgi:hemolysin activation/secretion protein